MRVAEVMRRDPITVTPQTTVKEAVDLMLRSGVSGLAVVNGSGELEGIVTEGDLLRRAELGTERPVSRWNGLFGSRQRQAGDYVHTHGLHVAEVMTRHPVYVHLGASLNDVVSTMEKRAIKQLPVLEGDRLVGIVSRADLLRALAHELPHESCATIDDTQIARSIREQIDQRSWAPRASLHILVRAGVVELTGSVLHEAERAALHVLVQNTAGVRRLVDHLVWIEPLSGSIVELPKVDPRLEAPTVAAAGPTTQEAASREERFSASEPPSQRACPDWNRSA